MKHSERKKKLKKPEADHSDFSESFRLGSENLGRSYTFGHEGSLAEVKRELTTMLDTMGPDTPQFQTTSSEADNDTSVISTSSITEHPRKADHSDPPTISQESTRSQGTTTSSETKNTSVLVELSSSQDGRVEEIQDLCDRAMYEVRSCVNAAHMQHSYMANQYANSDPYAMANTSQSNYLPGYYQEGDGFMKKRRGILEWFGLKPTLSPKTDLYKVKIKQEYPNTLPKQLTFERADGVPTPSSPFGIAHYPGGIQGPHSIGVGYPTTGQSGENPILPPPWHCTNQVPNCNRYEEHCTMCEMYGSDPHAIHSLNYCRSSFIPTCSDYSCPYLETHIEPHISPEHRFNVNQTTRPCENAHLVYNMPEMSHSAPVTNKDHKYTVDQRGTSYNGRLHGTKSIRQNYSTGSSPRKDDNPTKDVDSHLKTESAKTNCNTNFKNSPVNSASKVSNRCNKTNCACHTVQSVMEFGKESTSFGNPVGDDSEARVNNLMHAETGGMDQHNVTYYDTSGATRVDVYYFDHGNSGYYRTTDWAPHISSEVIARKTEIYTSKFWAEIFGTIHIGFSFCTSFILQFVRFTLYSLMRPLVIGIVQLGSDYFFKPSLSTCFNSVIQPFLIFLYNIASSIRDLCDPLAAGLGYYIREVAVFVRSFRIIEINHVTKTKPQTCDVCNQKGTPEEVRGESSR